MKNILKKAFSLVLVVAMLMSVVPVFATTISEGTNGKTIHISLGFSSDEDGENSVETVAADETFFIVVNYSGNPTVKEESIQGYDLLISYNPEKILLPYGNDSALAKLTTPTFRSDFTEGVAYSGWASDSGIVKGRNIVAEGILFVIEAKAGANLSLADLNSVKFIESATDGTLSQITEIKDGSREKFTVIYDAPASVDPPKADFDLSLADATYTYDGTAKELAVSGVVPAGAVVEYTSADFVDGKAIDAGEYNITATVKKDGYNDWTANAVLTIEPKAVSVTGITAADKVYDGTNEAVLSGGTISGLVARDSAEEYCDEHGGYRIKYYIPEVGTFADANAGTNKAVSIDDVVLTGCSAENYVLTQPTGLKANITKAPITVKANDVVVKVNDPIPTFDENSYEITSGRLFGEDEIKGSLATNCNSTDVEKDFAITKGTLTAGENYELTFVEGKLSVVDRTIQNIVVDGVVTEKTYGDEGFEITVTPDVDSMLDNFTITSSDENVATVDESGNVAIKGAGTTTISVREAGNEDYAPFEKSWTLTVAKANITITADNISKKIGQDDPELTYTVIGTLVGEDAISGELTRKPGETVGKYDILIGTLAINNNYEITFNKGVFEIFDKTPQVIAVAEIGAKTYGDAPFALVVTPDETSGLDTFEYESSNAEVAEVAADGTVTIKGAGEATITVRQMGNDEYAAAEASATLVVNPITVTVVAIDMDSKTATVEGILAADEALVELDFDNVKTTFISLDEETNVSTIKVSNFTFKGEKAKNYVADKAASLTTTVASATVEEPLTEDENVTIEAATAGDKNIIITDIAVAPEAEVKTVTIDATAIADSKVNAVAFAKAVIDAIVDIDEDVTLEVVLKDGSAENKTSTITLNAKALAAVKTEGESAANISISIDRAEDGLTAEQAAQVGAVSTKTPVVYSVNITDEAGNTLAASFGEDGKATVKFPYAKPAGSSKITVKHLDDAGTLTNIPNPKYDSTNQLVTVELGHFSEYLIYAEAGGGGGGGGGGAVSSPVVKFETNGGSKIANKTVKKNEVLTAPEAPVKEGYIFAGWYTDKELTTEYDFEQEVTKSFTLYAKWTEVEKEPDTDDEEKPAEEGGFADVKADAYYADAVKWAVDNNVTTGTSETTFSPDAECTRAQMVTFLWRAAGSPAPQNATTKFADIVAGSYYYDAVAWAVENGITSGISETAFGPDEVVNRAQTVTFLWRLAKTPAAEGDVTFADVDADAYYGNAVKWAVDEAITNGLTATSFGPDDACVRAQIVTFIYRYFVK